MNNQKIEFKDINGEGINPKGRYLLVNPTASERGVLALPGEVLTFPVCLVFMGIKTISMLANGKGVFFRWFLDPAKPEGVRIPVMPAP